MNVTTNNIRDIRKFGIVAFLFFGFLCVLGIWREKVFVTYFFGLLSLLGLGFILFPSQLRGVHEAWLNVAHVIGRIITITFLALAYYLVITPSALIKRVFGGVPLPLRPDKNSTSYWVERTEPAQPRERFYKRF
jgi:hypothetical protein